MGGVDAAGNAVRYRASSKRPWHIIPSAWDNFTDPQKQAEESRLAAKRSKIKRQIADKESKLGQLRASLALAFFRGRLHEDPNTGSSVIPNLKGFVGNIKGLSYGGSGGMTWETLGPCQPSSATSSVSVSSAARENKTGGRLGPVQAAEKLPHRATDARLHARETGS